MFENQTPLLWPQYQAGERKARRLRALAITASLRRAAQGLTGWLRALDRAAGRLIDEFAARRERHKAVRALHQLDDRMLRDIGIFRGEIQYIVRHGREERHPKIVAMPRRVPRIVPELLEAA